MNPEIYCATLGPASDFYGGRKRLLAGGLRYQRGTLWHDESFYNIPFTLGHLAFVEKYLADLHIPTTRSAEYLTEKQNEEARVRHLEAVRGGTVTPLRIGACKWKQYEHQTHGTEYLLNTRHGLLLDGVGLGKTKQAIDAVCVLATRDVDEIPYSAWNRRVVVCCPNALKEQWGEQLEEHSFYQYDCIIPSSITARRKKTLQTLPSWDEYTDGEIQWVVLNYEALRLVPKEFTAATTRAVLICDEVHRIKGYRNHEKFDTKVAKTIRMPKPFRAWGLTATPISNHAEDAWALMDLLRPGLGFWTFWEFDAKYIRRNANKWIIGYKNLKDLERRLSYIALGRKAEDCLDMPKVVEVTQKVDLGHEERKAYNMMEKNFVAWLEEMDIPEGVLSQPTASAKQWIRNKDGDAYLADSFEQRALRLRQICGGLVSEGAGKAEGWVKTPTKIDRAITLWKDAGRPRAIIWFYHKAIGRKIEERLMSVKKNRPTAVWRVDGDVDLKDRHAYVQRWRKAENGLLIAQIDCMSEGLNLQAGSYMLFVEMPKTPRQYEQAIGRMKRLGQESDTVTVVFIVAKNTLEVKDFSRMKKKIKDAENITAASFGKESEATDWRDVEW
jgi:SNF2 family DNA or RNA helicase